MELKGKRVLVLGLARTGGECARFLVHEGAQVVVSDLRNEEALKPEMTSINFNSHDEYFEPYSDNPPIACYSVHPVEELRTVTFYPSEGMLIDGRGGRVKLWER